MRDDDDLFNFKKRERGAARNTDPDTSHEAADRVDGGRLQNLIYQLLRTTTASMTTMEIAEALGIHPWSITPRMVQLERKKLVERDGTKIGVNSNGRQRKLTAWKAVQNAPLSAAA